ncbi:glycosyltransferase family 1 protein [Stigmatella sp. ncwal1]|uniref:Glycosyltransferase family 1 protein n=1 Tax=Stigmatella ashevillensis TaxID=2995309 RepID=A0ABT5D8L4_9BACT|nr:glycosyltransferase family 1 protein [Stigmatella ashevillena]MDC0709389.1 glycosyltransferase family 1 protein [Stigmatella ashevillena]
MSTGPIAFDASLWDEPTTGIGLYTRCLASALEAQGLSLERFGARTSGEFPRGALGRSGYVMARLPVDLRGSSARLYHALGNFNLPLTRLPGKAYVLTVHDLLPLTMPETVSAAFRWQFRLWLTRSLMLADRVVCVSASTRKALVARFPETAGRAEVVHNGVDHVVAEPLDKTGEALMHTLALPRDFVLYAGSLDVRKNVGLVLDALERLRARGRQVSLVLAGQSWFGSGPVELRVERMRAKGFDIRPLGYQSAPVFYELMRRAAVFVFPSRGEGFGLPPLEAMHLGTPAIVSNAGSLPEVCADAAPSVGPEDAEGLAALLERLLDSPAERRYWSEKGRRRAAEFTWKRAAEQTLTVYEAALRGLDAVRDRAPRARPR